MAENGDIKDIRNKLASATSFEYKKHAKEAMTERRVSESEVEETVKNRKLLGLELQEDGLYKLIFFVTKRRYLTLVVRFIGSSIQIITIYPVSVKRLKRYLKWAQKKRR